MALNTVNEISLSEKVTVELREAIQSGQLEPGQRLIERRLAEQLGVSHIPVREALARLADEGLIEREPRRGARVAALDATELEEISSLRTVLESFVVTRVQQRWTAADETKLTRIVANMVAAAEKGNVDSVLTHDRKFHEALWEMADHGMLMAVSAQLRGRINGFLRAANAALPQDALVEHALSHEILIAAIAGGDPAAAQAAMSDHIAI
ncbi:GntR family transcriptional regulator, partial [Leucobacter sp. M11]|uniref:GntR family transcriptional regulator n=1 Tax=Leucobacter sp. M11 TaxID=2993565 RepID=UPI002D7F1BF1